MKISNLGIFLCSLLLGANAARAADRPPLSKEEKESIASAIKLLQDEGALTQSNCDGGAEIDKSVLKELEEEGLLKTGTVKPQVVCIGSTPQ